MKRKRHIPKGFKFADSFGLDDIEWDEEAAAREAREAKKLARAEAHKLRSRVQQLFSPRVQRSLAKDRLWLERYARLQEYEKQVAKEEAATEALLLNIRTALHLQLERQWLAAQWERVKKAQAEINRSIVKGEREEFARRGILRGRRK